MSDAKDDADHARQPVEPGDVSRLRRLPSGQPARAAVVVVAYLLAVSAVTAALEALYGTLGLICAGLFAAAMTVPVAVLAPRPPTTEQDDDYDERPVLLRHVPKASP